MTQLCSCGFRVVVTLSTPPGAWHCTHPVLCLSHPWAILCSFSLSSHCSPQCCAPKPWDPRTASRHLPRQRALSERAKLAQDSEGRELRAPGTACRGVAGQQDDRGEPTLAEQSRVLPISLLTHPFVVSLRSPYQQICKPSTLLISTESKYSNLEFSLL